MTRAFAARTKVAPEKTRAEIEAVVKRYGAKGFGSGWQGDDVRIEFLCRDRHIRFLMKEPQTSEQARRQKWRSLLLLVKAKLEAVDAGIVTFEQAFVGDIVMSDGKTVWERVRDPIALDYSGKAVSLLEAAK
jgi:hypothetical protein